MSARILDGKPVADAIWADVDRSRRALGRQPTLAVVHAGDDPAAATYRRRIAASFARHGIEVRDVGASPTSMERLCGDASVDETVDAILLQTPLPEGLTFAELVRAIDPRKDVEGVHPLNVGLLAQGQNTVAPSTAIAAIELAKHHGAPIAGAHVVILGRSQVVGKPLVQLLLALDATVTVCHSKSRDLPAIARTADLLIAAIGRPRLVTAGMLSEQTWVIDVGINVEGEQIVGDVDFEAVVDHVAAISPVPGGVGPVTTAVLARNVLRLASRAKGSAESSD